MKAAFVSNPHYFRRVDASIATVFELGDPLAADDILLDVVSGKEYVVSERGFPPSRSSDTSCRLHWSREVSVTLRGNCQDSERRLLFAGDVTRLRCLVVKGWIGEKSQPLPVEVPIVGAVRLESYDCPAVLKVDEQLQAELVILGKAETQIEGGSVDYLCVNPDGIAIDVRVNVSSVDDAAEAGRILDWREEDAPVLMS